MERYGLSVRSRYCRVSDDELDGLIRLVVHRFPNAGYRMIQAHLRSIGFNVQESLIRASVQRVDPEGVATRWSRHRSIHRRVYSVPYPNALWHIDGNMSLIRWGFTIHGAIDGYSRLITYLRCSLNNKAQTVARYFVEACSFLGIPSRVRSDFGGENFDIAQFMLLLRGLRRGSHITGQSTRNQRVERLWRDVFANCLSLYYKLFYYLEDCRALDPDNNLHLLALQFVYKPRIEHSLNSFRDAWNNHSLRTENSCSPLQLWTAGLLLHAGSQQAAVQEIFGDMLISGEQDDDGDSGSSALETDVDGVENQQLIHHLQQHIDPLGASPIWGIDLYSEALHLIH